MYPLSGSLLICRTGHAQLKLEIMSHHLRLSLGGFLRDQYLDRLYSNYIHVTLGDNFLSKIILIIICILMIYNCVFHWSVMAVHPLLILSV